MKLSPEARQLRSAVSLLARHQPTRSHRLALPEQPFDSLLLSASALYLRSRKKTLQSRCTYEPSLLSSPRSLGGTILLENRIQYSPIQTELLFAALHPFERGRRLLELRTYTTSVFHEQSHRLLWQFLPRPSAHPDSIRRYLNFCESVVVMTDMALSDSLDSKLAKSLYLMGSIYDPGTTIRKKLQTHSEYRRYLLASMYSTYLNLELYHPKDISQISDAIFMKGSSCRQACLRALRLDRLFVEKTNPIWQHRNRKEIQKFLAPQGPRLDLPEDPFQIGIAVFWAERWLDDLGIP
ncbi:MAG: hypothetical protein KGQ59_08235 [Bdellovibrionales bacterium]|nr:hypothetical protein [Bdellovibrionales bacterium]